MASSSWATAVRVEKATSEFLIGPDWTMNIDICDTSNNNHIMLAKDVVKAVKKRLQHRNPKVQLLAALTTDMHVRDKILMLIASWHEAFDGPERRHPQYFMAYEDLRRSGVDFPRHSSEAAPIFTPPITHPISRHAQPGHGTASSSSIRLGEAMAAEESLSIYSMRDVLDLLTDMLQAVDTNDRSVVEDEVIVDLIEQCRANQKKLMKVLATTGDEELLCQGLELNDGLQNLLEKHDAIANGSPLPPQVTNVKPKVSEKCNSSLKHAEVDLPNAVSNANPSASIVPAPRGPHDEEEEEEDDFAQLARRHSKPQIDASHLTHTAPSGAPSSPVLNNALVPISVPELVQTKDQDIMDLLSITLSAPTSTEQTPHALTSPMNSQAPGYMPSASPGITFSSEAYYIAPWAQPQPQLQSQSARPPYPHLQPQTLSVSQLQPQSYSQSQAEQQPLGQPPHTQSQFQQYYPPPPWASTPGYLSNPNLVSRPPQTYSVSRPTPSSFQNLLNNVELRVYSTVQNAGQKPFIPSYRLFEDLNVLGNTDGRFKATSTVTPSLSGSTNQSIVGGRK